MRNASLARTPASDPAPSSGSDPTAGAAPATPPPLDPRGEQRQHLRFDKVFPVRIESILFGELRCVARNVSAGGIFLETTDPLPLGARVRVCFMTPDESAEIVALGEIKNHYFMNYVAGGVTRSVAGMGVRFLGFEQESQQALRDCLNRYRVIH
jgi:hypothetical protein